MARDRQVLEPALARAQALGVALALENGIFAFQGGTTGFWRYAVPAGSWASATAAPNAVGTGGALAYDGAGYIYALRGGTTRVFWRYDIAGGTWAALANKPANVGAGGALAQRARGGPQAGSPTSSAAIERGSRCSATGCPTMPG